MTQDFSGFLEELRSVVSTLRGKAEFRALEDNLSVTIEMHKTGQCRLGGVLTDRPGDTTLSFTFDSDQTYLSAALETLEEVVTRYPAKVFHQP